MFQIYDLQFTKLFVCYIEAEVLGMIFDYKMSWDIHVEKLLKEANSRTQAIRHIQPPQ